MRRLILSCRPALVAAVLIGVLLAAPACKRQRRSKVTTVEEDQGALASLVLTADPKASIQLLKGFHDIEQNSWRWTRGQFSVVLKVPAGAAQKGASLELRLTVPDPVIQHVKGTTLSSKTVGIQLEPQTFDKAGEYVYKRDIPASALASDAVTIDFALDRFIAAGLIEGRELGVIVMSIGLLAK